MPTADLPDRPDLERLKGHAKTLRDLVRAGVDGSIQLVREHHPRHGDLAAGSPAATGFKLADAQLTIARHYGFSSWPRLRAQVVLINDLTRSPHEQAVGGELADDAARADELLRLACLNYGADNPTRWADAERLLAEHPHLARASIHTAAATGDVAAAGDLLAADPSLANARRRPVPVGAVAVPHLLPTPARAGARPARRRPPPARRRRRPQRRLPVGRAAVAVHRADRRLRTWRAGRPAASTGAGPRPPPARRRRRGQRQPDDLQPRPRRHRPATTPSSSSCSSTTGWAGATAGHGAVVWATPTRHRPTCSPTPSSTPRPPAWSSAPSSCSPMASIRTGPAAIRSSAVGRPTRRPCSTGTPRSPTCSPPPAPTPAASTRSTRFIGLTMAADPAGVAAARQADPTLLDRARAERPDLVAQGGRGRPTRRRHAARRARLRRQRPPSHDGAARGRPPQRSGNGRPTAGPRRRPDHHSTPSSTHHPPAGPPTRGTTSWQPS